MEIKTKFNIGDTVYPIFESMEHVFKTCETCGGGSMVQINNTDRFINCPDCDSGGVGVWVNGGWVVRDNPCAIRGIETRHYSEKDSVVCVLDSITISVGYHFVEQDLFSTEEEAQKECELRNNKQ